MSDAIDDFFNRLEGDKPKAQSNMPKDNFREQNSTNQQVTGDARNIALNRNLKLFEPITALLERMYGPGFSIDLSQFKTSPIDEARFGPGGMANAPIGPAMASEAPTNDPNDPSTWFQGYRVDTPTNVTGIDSRSNLAAGPVQPKGAQNWCRVCNFGPNAAPHLDPNNPTYHQYEPLNGP